jgi:hypothetical protein
VVLNNAVNNALSLEALGVTASEARRLTQLRECDPEAYERELQLLRDRHVANKEKLKNRVSHEKVYSPGAKEQLDLQERTPVDGTCDASCC